jgi:hypothetical protein
LRGSKSSEGLRGEDQKHLLPSFFSHSIAVSVAASCKSNATIFVRVFVIKQKPKLVLLLAYLLAISLARQSFLHALLLAWFQVKGVTLDFFNDVFGLHLALETAQRILEGFALLYTNFCQD